MSYYYLDVASQLAGVVGSGWYLKDTAATFGIENSIIMESADTREVFTGWEGSGSSAYSGSSSSQSVVMSGPVTETALWKKQFQLVIEVEGHGTTNPPTQSYWEDFDSPVNLTASPDQGYTFEKWVIDNETSQNRTLQMTMDEPHIIKVIFTQVPLMFTPIYGVPLYTYLIAVVGILATTILLLFVRRKISTPTGQKHLH
jgi:hypothetical protein